MARDSEQPAGGFETENTGGVLSGFLAEEDEFDRRTLWRLGSWGVASVGAVVLAVYANQSSIGFRRDQVATADLTRQAQQIQTVARNSHSEARRLASAIDTLNGDRDRLFSRVTVLEQGLDTATGAIARQTTAGPAAPLPAWPAGETAAVPSSPPVVGPVATTAAAASEKSRAAAAAMEPVPAAVAPFPQATQGPPAASPPLMAAKSIMAPPDAAAGKLLEPEVAKKPEPEASKPAEAESGKRTVATEPIPDVVGSVDAATAEAVAPETLVPKVQRTQFGIDVGGANSVAGLRALWRGLLKSRSNVPLSALQPIIVIREAPAGLGMQLRLVAGPFGDAAAAAKICATLVASNRACETAVFDGQRLSMTGDEPPVPAAAKPAPRKRATPKRPGPAEESTRKPEASALSLMPKRS